MKRELLFLLAVLTFAAGISYGAGAPDCTGPSAGMVIGTSKQATAASASVGPGDLYVADELKVTGTSALVGAVTVTGATTFAAVKQGVTSSTETIVLTAASPSLVIASAAGTQTVTLPTAVGNRGLTFTIKKTGSAGAVTLTTTGTQTIDGANDPVDIDAQYDFLTIVSDNANWVVTSRYIQ